MRRLKCDLARVGPCLYTRGRSRLGAGRKPLPIWSSIRKPWFWYSLVTVVAWAGWALLLKLSSREISATATQFLATLGMLPVGLALLFRRAGRMERDPRGIFHAIGGGALSAAGIVALIAAFRSGGPTGVITVTTGLYPMVTVVLAVLLLKERLTQRQKAGLILAATAIVLFSL